MAKTPTWNSDPKGSSFWEGGGLGHVDSIFRSWAPLGFFLDVLIDFFNFLSVSNGI